uniref:E3 ubiquitin-protein ligase n=1 Tax=Ditylenchus dipsaci TaxID=166011 RepID=A0A915DHR2_9BILA
MASLSTVTCIWCQEDEILSYTNQAIVCSGFIQNSRIFSNKSRAHVQDSSFKHTYLGEVSSPSKNSDIFCPISMDEGVHISTCSHTMHSKCYNTFIDSLNARERSRPRQQSLNSRMINHEAGEFLCPLCKRLSNCALPFLPVIEQQEELVEKTPESMKSFKNWLSYTTTIAVEPLEGGALDGSEQDRKR